MAHLYVCTCFGALWKLEVRQCASVSRFFDAWSNVSLGHVELQEGMHSMYVLPGIYRPPQVDRIWL